MPIQTNSSKTGATIFGLVLAGGKSTRMGRDKGLLRWHGKEQRYALSDLLMKHCAQTFISCRLDQISAITAAGYTALPDSSDATEQYGAILSAMAAYPEVAWLVIACDMPLIDNKALTYLITQRDPNMLATAYKGPESNLPEPLAAIWEPHAKDMLLTEFTKGITCPRKALIRNESQVKLINPLNPLHVMNVNTPETAKDAMELIKNHAH